MIISRPPGRFMVTGPFRSLLSIRFCLSVVLVASPLLAQSTGQLVGTVVTEEGHPVADAEIRVQARKAPADGRLQSLQTVTDDQGNFEFTGIEVADYEVCIHPREKDLIDSCTWPSQHLSTRSTADRGAGKVRLVARRGQLLEFRIDDPARLAMIYARKGGPADLQVGVINDHGQFQVARVTQRDRTGQTHSLLVPSDTPLRVMVWSDNLKIESDQGQRLASGRQTLETNIKRGASAKVFRYKIVGLEQKPTRREAGQ